MITKARIVEHLGHGALLLPRLVRSGLEANDRAKVRMTVLQAASARAAGKGGSDPDLGGDIRAPGIEAAPLARVVATAARGDDAMLRAEGLAQLLAGLDTDVEAMVAAVEVGKPAVGGGFRERWTERRRDLAVSEDALPADAVDLITAAGKGADSIHRLVMELHKALNRLAADTAEEDVDGARCSGLEPADRRAVVAFMRGLARTRGLKFDHPGLDTTAARAGERLLIQNDIGTTDAHVLCITLDRERVSLTYSDVHRVRARFFVSLFADLPDVAWNEPTEERAEGLADGAGFTLVIGTLATHDRERRETFLEAIGAALVFLIDWNKARKQLRLFVAKDDAVAVLRWTARAGFGHRAFLEHGGARLVDGAIRRVAVRHIAYGVRLDEAIGRAQAVDFLEQVLRISTEAMLAGRSDRLVRDAVDAELASRLERSGSSLLQGVVIQAGLARDLAAAAFDHLGDRLAGRAIDPAALAARARRLEEKGDLVAIDLRAGAERFGLAETFLPLIDAMEQAIDELEEGVFFLTSMPLATAGDDGETRLADLCRSAVAAAEAGARMADAASCVHEGHRRDVDDALAALADLVGAEHRADLEERATIAAVLSAADASAARVFAVVECARRIEEATDRFAHAGHLMRALVIEGLDTRGARSAP
ncbi:MAG: hypothetical protein OEL76_17705 [Siculibacillus sp.]|nr:hypothetical protein [Siculibacillus sp.]